MEDNNDLQKQIKGYLQYLSHLERKATVEAKRMFPDHPYARKVWTMLCSDNGGMEEVVNQLSLHEEWEEYLMNFNSALDAGMTETASLLVDGFNLFCRQQLEGNFYLFTSNS